MSAEEMKYAILFARASFIHETFGRFPEYCAFTPPMACFPRSFAAGGLGRRLIGTPTRSSLNAASELESPFDFAGVKREKRLSASFRRCVRDLLQGRPDPHVTARR